MPFLPRSMFASYLLSTIFAYGAIPPPNLTPYETVATTEKLFEAHIEYKKFTPEIAKRTLSNYLEELDPLKIYFVETEIAPYLDDNSPLFEQVAKDYENQEFTHFQNIYTTFLKAIERRNSLEEKISTLPLPKNVDSSTLHKAPWARNEEELKEKLLSLRALQKESAEKLTTPEESGLFFQRITKRRISHEQEFICESKGEQKKMMLTCYLKAVASALDSHTSYFTPNEAKQFLIQVQQRLFGIGAQLRDDLNGFTIVHVVDGGPAARSGELKIGDKIVSVNHQPVIGMDLIEAVELIRGPGGSNVILTILRDNQKFDVSITRDEIVLKESRYESKVIPYGDGVIGYVALHSFYQDPRYSSTEDVKEAIESMRRNHIVYGMILDLRNNTGGLLPQAVQVTGLFIDKGVVASIADCNGQIQRLRNLDTPKVWDGPLVILTNRASASASEIVALALQDYGRALIVGDKTTYGKGSYQTFTLEGNSPDRINPQGEYKVTRGRYYTVGGNTPQLVGVQADILVPGILSEIEIGEQYTKYPLSNHHIAPQFEDDLSDVHPLYRMRMRKLLGKSTQQRLTTLEVYKDLLKAHSEERIAINPNYQNFISQQKTIEKHEIDFSLVGQNDLQLEEATNILKEMILYSKENLRAS